MGRIPCCPSIWFFDFQIKGWGFFAVAETPKTCHSATKICKKVTYNWRIRYKSWQNRTHSLHCVATWSIQRYVMNQSTKKNVSDPFLFLPQSSQRRLPYFLGGPWPKAPFPTLFWANAVTSTNNSCRVDQVSETCLPSAFANSIDLYASWEWFAKRIALLQ